MLGDRHHRAKQGLLRRNETMTAKDHVQIIDWSSAIIVAMLKLDEMKFLFNE
jgi:hypothetical protein